MNKQQTIEPGGITRMRYFCHGENAGFSSNVPISKKLANMLETEGYREVGAGEYYNLQHDWEKRDLLNLNTH